MKLLYNLLLLVLDCERGGRIHYGSVFRFLWPSHSVILMDNMEHCNEYWFKQLAFTVVSPESQHTGFAVCFGLSV